ncbi:hypothetical protein DL95DRAFT_415766 [Leptodontidium sp. 2 PMI_412]|nr:hypothetical protein DL95DRAFT_415766 [Leptodontidium sp. 2 PMI_412]
MASERSQSTPRGESSVQSVVNIVRGILPRPRFSRRNSHLRTPTLGNPVPSPTIVGSPPATPKPQPSLDRACSCRKESDEKNKRGGPPSPGAPGTCTCRLKGDEMLSRSDSGIAINIPTRRSPLRMASSYGVRERFSTGNRSRVKSEKRGRMYFTREAKLPKMCVPLSEISWRPDGSLYFSKRATKIIREMIPADEPAGLPGPKRPVEELVARQSSRRFQRWLKVAIRRIKNRNRGWDQRHRNLGKDYLLPKWGERRPKVKISLWIEKICINEDFVDWKDDHLTIYGRSVMRVLQSATIVIDKNHDILKDSYALSSWPKHGKIAVKKEGGDFDILMNHLQRGRRIWVCRTKSRKSVVDIPRTEKLWDARTLVFDSHRHVGAHMPLIRICQGDEPDNWTAAEKSRARMARDRLAGSLQELVERGNELECDGFLEMTTQLESIIRKGMDERAQTYRDDPCGRCRHNITFASPRMRMFSLEDDCVRELPSHDTGSPDVENPEAGYLDLDDSDVDAPVKNTLLERMGPDRYSRFVDLDPKRKNKKICFRDCHTKACTKGCSIDPNKIRRSWFKRALNLKPDPVKEKKPDIYLPKSRPLIRSRPCPPGWEMQYYSSIECNKQSWKGFRCTIDRCPKSYPGCPHADFVKPGQSSKGDNDLFKEHHRTEGLICWKDMPIIPFIEDKKLSHEENKRMYKSYKEDLQKMFEEFRNTPALLPPAPCQKPRRSKKQPRKVSSASTITPAKFREASRSNDTIKASSVETIKAPIPE